MRFPLDCVGSRAQGSRACTPGKLSENSLHNLLFALFCHFVDFSLLPGFHPERPRGAVVLGGDEPADRRRAAPQGPPDGLRRAQAQDGTQPVEEGEQTAKLYFLVLGVYLRYCI